MPLLPWAAIAALEYEKLLIIMQQPQSEQSRRVNIRSRARIYAARFEQMLDENRKNSLARQIAERQDEIGNAVRQLRRIDRSIDRSPRPLYVRKSTGPGRRDPTRSATRRTCGGSTAMSGKRRNGRMRSTAGCTAAPRRRGPARARRKTSSSNPCATSRAWYATSSS